VACIGCCERGQSFYLSTGTACLSETSVFPFRTTRCHNSKGYSPKMFQVSLCCFLLTSFLVCSLNSGVGGKGLLYFVSRDFKHHNRNHPKTAFLFSVVVCLISCRLCCFFQSPDIYFHLLPQRGAHFSDRLVCSNAATRDFQGLL
jgi:hypothetical protein